MPQEPARDSNADQAAVIAAYKASYHEKNRPPLSAAERQEREGNVSFPLTPAIRATLTPVPKANRRMLLAIIAILLFAGSFYVLWMVVRYPWYSAALGACLPVVLLCVSRGWESHRMRQYITAVNQVQSYDRYAGPCAINEVSHEGGVGQQPLTYYTYLIAVTSPPARVPTLQFAFQYQAKHSEICQLCWATIEYVGTRVLSVRDEYDRVVYQFPGAQ